MPGLNTRHGFLTEPSVESNRHIYVINPNSLTPVTQEIDRALAPLRFNGAPQIHCVTLAEGPPGIQTQRDVDSVVLPLCNQITACEAHARSLGGEASAFVIACFSDPGLHAARESTSSPVLGIAECGVLSALSRGLKFGVISILQASIARHWRYFSAMGVIDRLAADLPVGLGVAQLTDRERTLDRMREVGTTLRDQHGADVIVLGCAGMPAYRKPLEESLGIPVIDPTQVAVTMALGQVAFG